MSITFLFSLVLQNTQNHSFVSCALFSEAVQEKLLSDYEAEMKKDASKKPSHAKKDSNASDDWEKLSDDASSKWFNARIEELKPFCIFAEFYIYIFYTLPSFSHQLLPCTASYAELWESYLSMTSQLCISPKCVIHTVPLSQVEKSLAFLRIQCKLWSLYFVTKTVM